MYLFVVALGTDYNILMIARLREEAAEGMCPAGRAAALRHAGPTIGAAGLILAGTFASLTLAGNTILPQIGFAVSSGIALAAFVIAMFFSPASPPLQPCLVARPRGQAPARECPARTITARCENTRKSAIVPNANGARTVHAQQRHRLPGGAAGPRVLPNGLDVPLGPFLSCRLAGGRWEAVR